MISETLSLEIPFFDVDSMNIVWHGHYAKYIELARCKLLEKIGYSYKDMAASGYSFPIIDMHIKYAQPLTFGQVVDIQATLVEWEYGIKIKYEIFDHATGSRLTKAHTLQAAVDMKSQEMRLQCPKIFTDKVESML